MSGETSLELLMGWRNIVCGADDPVPKQIPRLTLRSGTSHGEQRDLVQRNTKVWVLFLRGTLFFKFNNMSIKSINAQK